MLIYNYQKEFLGIDEKDLKILGFETLAELKAEVNDFADLFIKSPGYIHNFKHVHWIDFIAYANEGEAPKVLININAQTFTAKLTLQKAYLADNPSKEAFLIYLQGLRSLSSNETQNIATETTLKKELPQTQPEEATVSMPTSNPVPEVTPTLQEPVQASIQKEVTDNNKLSIDIDASLFEKDEEEPTPYKVQQQNIENLDEPLTLQIEEDTLHQDEVTVSKENQENDFHYDPNIASRELGLPLDLIEEFIEDFIAQANEFKTQIYNSLDTGDIDNVKILAHKLKGVAANLRVTNAHEALASISATSDTGVIRENIDAFYLIMQRLEGKEPQEKEQVIQELSPTIEIIDDVPVEDEHITLTIDDIAENIKQEDFPIPSYSKEAVAQEIGLSKEDFSELFSDYENEARTILTKMKTAADLEDFATVHSEALKLKGMSDNMRLQAFTKELAQIMDAKDKELIINTVALLNNQLQYISKMEA
jgi:HPt (histidine-containing phosphotransfer) domain-containing protein